MLLLPLPFRATSAALLHAADAHAALLLVDVAAVADAAATTVNIGLSQSQRVQGGSEAGNEGDQVCPLCGYLAPSVIREGRREENTVKDPERV